MELMDWGRLEPLRDALVVQGFTGIQQRFDEDHFGNQLLVLARDGFAVQLLKDRSQYSAAAARLDWADWFDVSIWLAWLQGRPAGIEAIDENQEADLFFDNIDLIKEESRRPTGDPLSELREIRAQRAVAMRDRWKRGVSRPE